MKDTKIPQLIINDLTKKQYESITPAQDQFYITDEDYKDIPIGFISLEYFAEHGFNSEDEKYIWKKQNTIAKLLNMNR